MSMKNIDEFCLKLSSIVDVTDCFNDLYPFLNAQFWKAEILRVTTVLFHTDSKTCKLYLVRHMMISVAWKQSYSISDELLDISCSKIMSSFSH